jgi:transketolase
VGNGGGYTYGIMGSTHHALEDIAALKSLPNLQLFFPCSNNQVAAAAEAMNGYDGPSYLRLSISGYPRDDAPLRENARTLTRTYRTTDAANGVTVIAAGHAAQIALTLLHGNGAPSDLDIDLFGVSRLPFDPAADAEIMASVKRTKRVIVIEEHYAAGGVGESLAPILATGAESYTTMTAKYATDQLYGGSRFHLEQSGLTPAALEQTIRHVRQA